jgi:FkbM family methyltransferase
MNFAFAKEVGYFRYIVRRILWRINPPATFQLPTGLRFRMPPDKFFASDVFVTEANVDWNAELIFALFLKDHKSGDFIDVGAHLGYYSLFMAPFATSVWSFEPDRRNLPNLREALKDLDHAHIVESAVADFDGHARLSAEGESSVSHLDLSNDGPEDKKIPTISIDSFIDGRSLRPIGIKIDIEGFDILALEGAKKSADKFHPVFLVEYNQEPGKPNTWDRLREFLKVVDYRAFAVSRKDRSLLEYEYQFGEVLADQLEVPSIKMFFLVPQIHIPWFQNYATKHPRWSRDALKLSNAQSALKEASSV